MAVFLGAHLYTRRLFEDRFQRRVALVLALFALSPVLATIDVVNVLRLDQVPYAGTVERQFVSIGRELMPIAQLLGYPWAAITVGADAAGPARLRARPSWPTALSSRSPPRGSRSAAGCTPGRARPSGW